MLSNCRASDDASHILNLQRPRILLLFMSSVLPSAIYYARVFEAGLFPCSRPLEVRDAPARTSFAFDTMEDALSAFEKGEFLLVMDDERRENEGDLIIAASEVSTEKMAWLIKHTSGYICIALPGKRLDELEIPMMVAENQDPHRTAYTVTVDYRHGMSASFTAPGYCVFHWLIILQSNSTARYYDRHLCT
ncbi:hypothetical protein AcV7_005173 [Taiwanofungus camphoratus]|nr:hypothetical protein AcV7_005173 [Antrodia cinnamomea]